MFLYFWMMHSAVASPSASTVSILHSCVVPLIFWGDGFCSQVQKDGTNGLHFPFVCYLGNTKSKSHND